MTLANIRHVDTSILPLRHITANTPGCIAATLRHCYTHTLTPPLHMAVALIRHAIDVTLDTRKKAVTHYARHRAVANITRCYDTPRLVSH